MYKVFILLLFLTGCSVFQPKDETLQIITSKPNSQIFINGEFKGKGSVLLNVNRNHSITIKVENPGFNPEYRFIQVVPSLTGKLDTIGVYLLFPGIGLLTDGAYELENNNLYINLE